MENNFNQILLATIVIALIIAIATIYVYFQEKKERDLFYGLRKRNSFDNWDEFESWDK